MRKRRRNDKIGGMYIPEEEIKNLGRRNRIKEIDVIEWFPLIIY
jgi:hypothetical protein